MASFASPNETVPLPNSSALSLAVVFVDNGYNEEAMKKAQNVLPGLLTPSTGSACQRGVGDALSDADADPGARTGHSC